MAFAVFKEIAMIIGLFKLRWGIILVVLVLFANIPGVLAGDADLIVGSLNCETANYEEVNSGISDEYSLLKSESENKKFRSEKVSEIMDYSEGLDFPAIDNLNDDINSVVDSSASGEEYEFAFKWGKLNPDWNFGSPSDIAVDDDGNVYVAEGYRIQKFTRDGKYITSWKTVANFGGADSIAIGSEGNIYAVDSGSNSVYKFTPDGNLICKWGGQGSGDGQFSHSHGIAVDNNGTVYVADSYNQRIQKFTSDGEFISKWDVSSGSGDDYYPAYITVDSAGNVYVSESLNKRILKFSSNGVFIAQWGTKGAEDGEYSVNPSGIEVDCAGYVYVADNKYHCIQKFTSNGTLLDEWGMYGSAEGQFDSPSGITVDIAGDIYIADTKNSRIQKFTSDGTFLFSWGSNNAEGGELKRPEYIAFDDEENVYITDNGNNQIQVFDSSGNFLAKWGVRGSADGQFVGPRGIAIDNAGYIYVVDSGNNRIQKFTPDGTFIGKWGSYGSWYGGKFDTPWCIAVDNGYVYVTDTFNNRVQKFTSDGTYVSKWGTYGPSDGMFYWPNAIATDNAGDVYVGDGTCIQKFTPDGEFIERLGKLGSDEGEFDDVTGLSFDENGNIYATDFKNCRVQKLTSDGTFICKWGVWGSEDGQFEGLHGIAVNSSGYVYVVDSSNNRVQVFRKKISSVIPKAEFSATPVKGLKPLTVQFMDESTGNPAKWSWDFGDGGASSQQNPEHIYTETGTYSVTLEVSNSADNDSITKTDYITVTPQSPVLTEVKISPSQKNLKIGDTQQFTATGYDQYDQVIGGSVFYWSSSNTSVGTVSSSGMFTAENTGSTVISATSSGVTCHAQVQVGINTPVGTCEWNTTIHAANELEPVILGMNPAASDDYNPAFDKYNQIPIQGKVMMLLDDLYGTKIKASVCPGEYCTWDLSVSLPDSSSSVLTWDKRPESNVEVRIFNNDTELFSGAVLEGIKHELKVKAYVSEKVTYSLHLNPGWNMISLPVTPDDSSVSSVFEGLTTLSDRPVVTWKDKMFTEAEELEPGVGYWVFSSENVDFEIIGMPVDEPVLTLNPGWNMIGTAGNDNLELTSIPNQDSSRPAVTWKNKMFTTVTSLEPGSGAWIFVTKTTEVIL